MAKKHYRAAKKQVQMNKSKGIFIPDDKKSKLCILAFSLLLLAFLKGLLIGYITGRND